MRLWRSLLFVPGDNGERLAKAASRGADAIIVDLEDAVAPTAKDVARGALAQSAAALSAAGAAVVVRINSAWRDAMADLEVAVNPDVTAILAPKVESAARLQVLSEMMLDLERARDLQPGSLALIALIEAPAALRRLDEIASVRRLAGLALGTEDFSLALGVPPTPECLDLPCRQVALAAAPRGLMALAIPISIAAFRDEPAFRAAAVRSRAFGATGALCIHPSQVSVANEVFQPTEAELADAEAILAAWAQANGERAGVTTLNGKMIDRPVVERARLTIARRPTDPGVAPSRGPV